MSSELDGKPPMSARPRIYPMSHEQETLWLDDLLSEGPSRHLEAWACRLTGQLDTGALEWAISQIVARHEVLRTRLTERDEEPVQIVTGPDPVRMHRLSCPPAALHAELSRIVVEPLDLDETPIRPWLVCVSPDEFVLVVQLHHAVIDDWSLNIFQRELMHFYTARLRGKAPSLEPLRMQAGDFAVAQRAAGLDPADLAYWRERVRHAPRSCTIPPTRPGSGVLTRRAWDDRLDALEQHLTGRAPTRASARPVGRHLFEISPELGQAVRIAGRALRTTPFTVFASAMAALLWQYGESDEVIFCTPVSLRGAADVDGMIGVLTNLQPIRLTVSRDMSFRALTNAAKAEILGGMEHRAVPYPAMIRMSRLGTSADAPPPCDVAIGVDDMGWEPFSLPNVTTEIIRLPGRHAKFAVQLDLVAQDDGGYAGALNYDAEVFDDATVAGVATRFTKLLAHCIAAPDEPLDRIPGSAGGPCRA
jgi:condensation domain-containing protein